MKKLLLVAIVVSGFRLFQTLAEASDPRGNVQESASEYPDNSEEIPDSNEPVGDPICQDPVCEHIYGDSACEPVGSGAVCQPPCTGTPPFGRWIELCDCYGKPFPGKLCPGKSKGGRPSTDGTGMNTTIRGTQLNAQKRAVAGLINQRNIGKENLARKVAVEKALRNKGIGQQRNGNLQLRRNLATGQRSFNGANFQRSNGGRAVGRR